MLPTKLHTERIKQELRAVGATSFGLMKFASRYLPKIIHEDEHVRAAVYGRYKVNGGWLAMSEGVLVATDSRIIFLDHKPGFTSTEEVTYDVVVGVRKTSGGPFAAVTLYTRVGNFTIRFAHGRTIDKFVEFIEKRRLESPNMGLLPERPPAGVAQLHAGVIDSRAIAFLKEHDLGVLSTVDRAGTTHGAAVYYLMDANNLLYILTKAETQKVHDILAHHQVALTVVDASRAQTVQLQGIGAIEASQTIKNQAFMAIMRRRPYDGHALLPPVAAVQGGAFMVLKVTPMSARFIDFQAIELDQQNFTKDPGAQHIPA